MSEISLSERLDWVYLPVNEKYRRAIPPMKISCNGGRYKEGRHKTVFDVRESDSLNRELDSFVVTNQRETAVKNGKAEHFYVWSCSCGKENCRHVPIAKRVYFEKMKKRKDAEAWLLKNDPSYVTAKMAAEGWIGGAPRTHDPSL